MRKSVALPCSIVAVAAGAGAAANAGEPTITPAGDFAVADVEVLQPISSSRRRPRGARLDIREFIGNRRTGGRPTVTGAMGFRFPRGMTFNASRFAECRPDAARPEDCPAASRIGSGRIEVDARPAASAPLKLRLLAYNGARRNGRRTLLFFAFSGESTFGVQVGELRREASGPHGTVLAFPRPQSPPPYTITQLSLRTIDRTVRGRIGGRRVRRHLVETPRSCRGSWSFASYQELSDGTVLTATDTTPCFKP